MQTTARALRGRPRPSDGRRAVALRVVGIPEVQGTATSPGSLALNVGLASFFALLAGSHVAHGRTTGDWASVLPILVQEAILVVLFLARRPAAETSRAPGDWLAALAGVGLPLCLRPTVEAGRLAAAGDALQLAGVAANVVCLAWLGRRVGIVAANRGIETAGPYRVVRHPAYAAYYLCYLGYLLVHPTAMNGILVTAWVAVTHVRVFAEERLLARDPRYRRYCERVRWRWLPGVW
jgi:protein-S-isoprenylcysteine O-methyltransferase Ste14